MGAELSPHNDSVPPALLSTRVGGPQRGRLAVAGTTASRPRCCQMSPAWNWARLYCDAIGDQVFTKICLSLVAWLSSVVASW